MMLLFSSRIAGGCEAPAVLAAEGQGRQATRAYRMVSQQQQQRSSSCIATTVAVTCSWEQTKLERNWIQQVLLCACMMVVI
jgi:hypothetical protein